MSKKDLVQKIKTLDNLTQQEKAYLVELINAKKYGLVWENKPEKVEQQLKQNLPILKEVKEKYIKGSPLTPKGGIIQNEIVFAPPLGAGGQTFAPPLGAGGLSLGADELPNHILIEGDNLHALTALSFTHENKIDVIYIDPPYNTGNKDFKYNDSFVDKEDTYRHSKWLSFMSKRLQIAKKLLNENGVIFCSIDNNEGFQLKMLCDEIFGEHNFIENFIWNKTSTPPALSKKSRKTHEYILCYQKQLGSESFIGLVNEGGDAPILNDGNKFATLSFPKNYVKTNLKDGIYISGERDRTILENDVEVKDGIIITDFSLSGNFRWTQKTLNEEIKENCILIIKSEKFAIRYCRLGERSVAPPNYITSRFYEKNSKIDKNEEQVDTNETAGKELIEILGTKIFDFPKPTSLIKYFISFISNKNLTILDFFAGSGTTLHATMALNAEDGGNRQCILVTNNENNICEEVTYERNKRVIEGYNNAKGIFVEGLGANNLRYYQCGFVSRSEEIKYKKELVLLATDLLCIKENCYELSALSTPTDLLRVYVSEKSQFLVIYDEDEISTSIDIIQQLQAQKQNDNPIKVYVFANGHYPFTEDFEEVLSLITLCALPDAIYKALQNVLPTREHASLEFEEENNENNELGDLFSFESQ